MTRKYVKLLQLISLSDRKLFTYKDLVSVPVSLVFLIVLQEVLFVVACEGEAMA